MSKCYEYDIFLEVCTLTEHLSICFKQSNFLFIFSLHVFFDIESILLYQE